MARPLVDVPPLEGVGPEDAEERIPPRSAFEVGTINRFIKSAISGNMPGNQRSTQPLFPAEYMRYFSTKYAEWAPEPYASIPGPQSLFGPIGGQSPPPLIRIMTSISGLDDIFNLAIDPETLERSFVCTKTKLWFGMEPMSDARWRAKALNDRKNVEEAMAQVELVVDVWRYLATTNVQGKIRQSHNKIWTEIDVFQDALKARATAAGEPAPEFSITKLWEEFMRCHTSHMETQARAWVFKRMKDLHQGWKDHLLQRFMSGRVLNETQETVWIDHYAIMIMNKLQDIYLEADLNIHSRTDGMITSNGMQAEFVNIDRPADELNQEYERIENHRMAAAREHARQALEQRIADRRAATPYPEFMETINLVIDREWAHKHMQPEVENPKTAQIQGWVSELAEDKVEAFGFVAYRTSYSENDEEWKSFLTRLESGLSSGWEGMIGADKIMKKATLHWIDGREHSIPEGDNAAVQKHFKTFISSPDFPKPLTKEFCLAIPPIAFQTFAKTRYGDRKGDYRGSVVAIDAKFDSAKTPRQNNTSPGYAGWFPVIDQLVWTDLYATGCFGMNQRPEDYWALAMQHPWGVYVGPTTGVRRREWRKMRAGIEGLAWGYKQKIASESSRAS